MRKIILFSIFAITAVTFASFAQSTTSDRTLTTQRDQDDCAEGCGGGTRVCCSSTSLNFG